MTIENPTPEELSGKINGISEQYFATYGDRIWSEFSLPLHPAVSASEYAKKLFLAGLRIGFVCGFHTVLEACEDQATHEENPA